jgi:hypothetical protein
MYHSTTAGPVRSGPIALAFVLALVWLAACSNKAGADKTNSLPDVTFGPSKLDVVAGVTDIQAAQTDDAAATDAQSETDADDRTDAAATDVVAGTDAQGATDVLAATDVVAASDTGSVPDVGAGTDAAVAPSVVRFVAIGDAGKANDGQKAVGKAIAAKCKASGCDMVLLLGDNFYDTGVKDESDGQFITKFEQPYADVDAPFWVSLGNHDYGGEGAGYELWKADYYKKYAQKNPKFVYPSQWWDKVAGPAHFFAMDTNLFMYGLGQEQINELKPKIVASNATWKIAFGHHPLLSNGKHGNAGQYEGIPGIPIVSGITVKSAYDEIICGKVDILFTGHDHSRQYLKLSDKCPGTVLIVSGAGASTTEINGKSFFFDPAPAWFQDADKPGFLWVELKGEEGYIEFINQDGLVEYSRTFSKKNK